MNEILKAILILAGSGALLGLLLAVASNIFAVEKDEKAEAITELLPGANCGGCGYMGCGDYAEKLAKNEAPVGKCAALTDASTAKICKILGIETVKVEKRKAKVLCSGGYDNCKELFIYDGVENCIEAANVIGGPRACEYGCLGFGACVSACKWNAISIGKNGIAKVNEKKCRGCGACVETCPKNVIVLLSEKAPVYVGCSSHDFGRDVMNICQKGCIGCKACMKACESGAISFPEGSNLPVFDYSKCIGCYKCLEKCPRKIIKKNM